MRRYAKPIVVADDLALLHGPVDGVVILPGRVAWSSPAEYDLDSPGRIADLYRTVLIEATEPVDLHKFLDRVVLTELWPSLWLPTELRRAWEERFPELPRTGSGTAASWAFRPMT